MQFGDWKPATLHNGHRLTILIRYILSCFFAAAI